MTLACRPASKWLVTVVLVAACESTDEHRAHLEGPEHEKEVLAAQPKDVGAAPSPDEQKSSSASKFDIKTAQDPVTGETRFVLEIEKCSFEARAKVEGTKMFMGKHSNCALPPADYMDLWRQVFGKAIDTLHFGGDTIHLGWGRLAAPAADAMAASMSHRLAASIRNAPSWDLARGKLKEGQLESFVREQARPEVVIPELVPVARDVGFNVATQHVETVLVGSPDTWPSGGGNEFSRNEKLPYDARIEFVLSKLPN